MLGRLDQTLGLAYGSTITATQDPDNGDSRAIGDRIKLDWQGNVAVMDGQMLVLGADNASPSHGLSPTTAEPQSGLWFGKTDDLWSFGKPKGWGGG